MRALTCLMPARAACLLTCACLLALLLVWTEQVNDPDSCTALGLQMAVPRTPAHLAAMVRQHGTKFFSTVPGVFGIKVGSYI